MCGRVGWLVGWLVGPRAAGCLFVRECGAGVCGRPGGVVACLALCERGIGLVCPSPGGRVGSASRERACLREVCGWVGNVEGVAFLEELFCLVGGDDAPDDGRPCQRVFAACAYGEELGGELWCGYWAGGVFAVWAGVAECGVFGGGSDGCRAAVGFE